MKYPKQIFFLFALLLLALPVKAEEGKEGDLDLQEILFGHIQDSYEWHVTDVFGEPVVIHLPIIFYSSQSGMHVYMSSQFEEEAENGLRHGPDGFSIRENGGKGEVVETVNGEIQAVPFDISITKTVAVLFINAILLLICVLIPARWCKKHKLDDPAPKGFTGFMHMFIMYVYEDVIKSSLGNEANKYAPYLLTCFFFIFFSNIMGIIPFPPGGGNLTGNITCTMFLALCTFVITNFTGTKEYWKEIFWPDVPTWLKVPVPLMPFIELFGIITKPLALMIRLFANMLAGHAVAISLTCLIFIMFALNAIAGVAMIPVSVALSVFMMLLEVLVCFIQAFVFTLLSAVFISLAHVKEHEVKEIR